jgi:hypothetical protein
MRIVVGSAEPPLLSVLKSWHGMVERVHWDVDKSGVRDGMGKWKEADGEETWERNVLAVREG